MKTAPLLDDVRARIARFSADAVLTLITAHPRQDPPFLIARLVRELAQLDRDGSLTPTEADLSGLLSDLGNLYDPVLGRQIGGNFSEIVLTRVLAPQLHTQRDFLVDFPRVLSVLADPDASSPIGQGEWRRLLGVDLVAFLLGVMVLSDALANGPLNLETYLAIDGESEPNEWIRAVVAKLAGDLPALQRVAAEQPQPNVEDQLYQPGPLLALPLYRRSDGRIAAPSVDYLRLASSPPSLYIRLIQADIAERSEARRRVLSERFHAHLVAYAGGGAAPGWELRDLDREPPPRSELADIAIWPGDRSFLVLVEAKATLQALDAQLGHDDSRQRMAALYQKSFDQIDATVRNIGQRGFLADAPTDVPVFGLAVTFDLHLTTVIGNATHVGVVLGYKPPHGPNATSVTPCRVLSAADFEDLTDLLAWARAEQVQAVLDGVFAESCPARTSRKNIADKLGEIPEHAPINPLIVQAFERVADSVDDPALAQQIRSATSSLTG